MTSILLGSLLFLILAAIAGSIIAAFMLKRVDKQPHRPLRRLQFMAIAFMLIGAGTIKSEAQTNTTGTISNTVPTVQGALDQLLGAVQAGETNWDVIPYVLYAPGLEHKYGGGLAFMYPLSTYVVTGARVDWVNGGFWMPSGNATLQLPLKLSSWFTFTPFTYAGIGVPLSGATVGPITLDGKPPRDNNGQPTAILGIGGAIDIWKGTGFIKKFSLIADVEQWTGFRSHQFRFGGLIKF